MSQPAEIQTAPVKANAPRWMLPWLAFFPTVPGIGVLAIGLVKWSALHHQARLVLLIFAASQLIAALFTPHVPLSLLLTGLRSGLLIALVCSGVRLQAKHLVWLLIGLVIVYFTSVLDAFLGQRSASLLDVRLLHPFLTSPSLGLAGAFGVILCVTAAQISLWWRIPVGLLALVVCVLSGSRAPLLGLIVGLLIILTTQKRRVATLILGGSIFLAFSAVGNLSQNNTFERYSTIDNSDRDLIWSNTLSVVAAHPLGGVGPYQLGGYLQPPDQACELWPSLTERGIACPRLVKQIQGAWLIAHNLALQQLAETGLLGSIGYVVLLGFAVPLMLRASPVVAGLCALLLVVSLVDNVLVLPSPFFAEVFWIAFGIALNEAQARRQEQRRMLAAVPSVQPLVAGSMVGLTALTMMAVFLFPLWTSLRAPPPAPPVQLIAAGAARTWKRGVTYPTEVILRGSGQYRVVLRACITTCRTLVIANANLDAGHTGKSTTWETWMQPLLPSDGTTAVQLRLELYPLKAPPLGIQPLSRNTWEVEYQ